jgi:hypothetical protein
VHAHAPAVGDVLGRYLLEHPHGTAMRAPAWTLRCALREQEEVFGVAVGWFGLDDYVAAAGGLARRKKRVREAIEEIGLLQGQRGCSGRSPASPARVELGAAQLDRARALGVLLELEDGHRTARFITGRDALKGLMEEAAPALLAALKQAKAGRKAEQAERRRLEREAKREPAREETPLEALEREHRAALRGFADRARPANLALGDALLTKAAVAEPTDLDVARVSALCGGPHRTNYADRLTMRISRARPRGNGDKARGRTWRGQSRQRSRLWRQGGRPCPRPTHLSRAIKGQPTDRSRADALRVPADAAKQGRQPDQRWHAMSDERRAS